MAEIRFLPACSFCGAVLWEEEIDYGRDETVLWRPPNIYDPGPPQHIISPGKCPKCGAVFTSITIPGKLPYSCQARPMAVDGDEPVLILKQETGR